MRVQLYVSFHIGSGFLRASNHEVIGFFVDSARLGYLDICFFLRLQIWVFVQASKNFKLYVRDDILGGAGHLVSRLKVGLYLG